MGLPRVMSSEHSVTVPNGRKMTPLGTKMAVFVPNGPAMMPLGAPAPGRCLRMQLVAPLKTSRNPIHASGNICPSLASLSI